MPRLTRTLTTTGCIGLSLWLTAASAPTQDAAPAAEIQKKTGEWIETRRLISKEAADWATEKATLTDLNAIRKTEIEKLDEFIKIAETRVKDLDEKRTAFSKEETDLRQWRAQLEPKVAALETEVRPLIKIFPAILREKVEEPAARMEADDSRESLQNRMRDLLKVTQAILAFQNSLHTDNELREIDGEKREIDVLYLGLAQAYYVDQTGKYAGYGTPAADGWKWVEAPQIAAQTRLAIDVLKTNVPPRFVTLPFVNLSNTSN